MRSLSEGVAELIERGREVVEHADDVILHGAEPLGAFAAVAVLHQQRFGAGAPFGERDLQPLRDRGAQLALAARISLAQPRKIGRDRIGIDEGGRRAIGGRKHGEIPIAEPRKSVTISLLRGALRGRTEPNGFVLPSRAIVGYKILLMSV